MCPTPPDAARTGVTVSAAPRPPRRAPRPRSVTPDASTDLLVLHAVRILGFADTAAVCGRFALDRDEVEPRLRAAATRGWTSCTTFGDTSGWSLTGPGRAENERLLASELDATGRADEVRELYARFLPLNAALLRAVTDWQLRPVPGDRFIPNDHVDGVWDAKVLRTLAGLGGSLATLVGRLAAILPRFGGYDHRFRAALARARTGEHAWVDRTDVDSCHRVWFELHEDLIATLGIDRGAPPDGAETDPFGPTGTDRG